MDDNKIKLDRGVQLFREGCNCAQASLEGIAPKNLSSEQIQLLCSAFGGGIARYGKTCGAITGALMGIGLQHGYTQATKEDQSEACVDLSQAFIHEFTNMFGATDCKELIGYDISDSDKKEAASKSGVFKTLCPKYVAGAIKIVQKLNSDLAK